MIKDSLFLWVDLGDYEKAFDYLDKNKTSEKFAKDFNNYVEILRDGNFEIPIDNDGQSSRALQCLSKGIVEYAKNGNETSAFDFFKSALSIAKMNKDSTLMRLTLRYTLEVYERFQIKINDQSYNYVIEEYKNLGVNAYDLARANLYAYRIHQRFNFDDTKGIFGNYIRYASHLKNLETPYFKAKRDLTFFLHHHEFTKNLDSARFYLLKSFSHLKGRKGYFENERWLAAKISEASLLIIEDRPILAINVLDSLNFNKDNYLHTLLRLYVLHKKHLAYQTLGDEMNSFRFENEWFHLNLELNQIKSQRTIAEIEEKYQNSEKEKQILEAQQKSRANRNWLIAAIGLSVLGALIAFLLNKNTTKKRKLAEQQQLLEQQKVATLLKEQELVSIDAMIEGQEKERTKVANELHDDLGSLMATVKLHFDNVKVDKKDPALKNAQKLLEEAYQKVRGIAHSKNSGVMADQGLLPAVKKMARTISETNALAITVEDFGLGERLENSLELTIFRIIQELIANIIKHSGASTATIQFTQHEDNLNIIVEDNGKGFDMSAIKRGKNGMGLGTIEKRIEHLEGSFTVDSILGKGTSILIDIPV